MTNRNRDQIAKYVERWANIEREFNEAKAERGDMVKDLRTEIKSRADEIGSNAKEIEALVKIKLAEAEFRQDIQDRQEHLDSYEVIFGPPTSAPEDDEV